jgi:Tol biopolymer transport system component
VAASADRRGPVRAAGAALALAVLGLSLAAGAAQATTFPGTNGRITASGALNTHPLNTGSRLELFTIRSAYSDPAAPPKDECQLTDNEDSDYNPRYSKDGKKVVFVQNGNLWTMQLDNTGRAPSPGSTDPTNPCSQPGSLTAPYPLPNQPGDQKLLTVSGQDTYVGGWCTDSSGQEWVVFQRNMAVAGGFEVFKQKVTSNRDPDGLPVNVSNNAASDSQPSVRPDCSKIAFHSNRAVPSPPSGGGSLSNIWVMNFDGTSPAPVTDGLRRTGVNVTNQGSEESAPSWSPGTATSQGGTGTKYRIAFQTDRDTATPRNLEIYRIDEDGANPTRLSYNGHSGGGGSGDLTGYDLVPSYSPDGTRICFHSGRAQNDRGTGAPGIIGQWEIYTLDADGEYHVSLNTAGSNTTEQVTTRAGNDERCGWQAKP